MNYVTYNLKNTKHTLCWTAKSIENQAENSKVKYRYSKYQMKTELTAGSQHVLLYLLSVLFNFYYPEYINSKLFIYLALHHFIERGYKELNVGY